MLGSLIQVQSRRGVAYGTLSITAVSVGLSVAVTYLLLRGSEESYVLYGLLISFVVPMTVAPLASVATLEVLRENFMLSQELKQAAKVAERLAIAEASAKARQASSEALEAEIAERKRIEAELRASNKSLEAANSVKSRFLENINREIRAPMGRILDLIDVLSETEKSHHQSGSLAELQHRTVALFTTINDILDLAQLEAGDAELEIAAFDPGACVEDCVDTFTEKAASKGVEIILDIAPSVPWRVYGDELRLRQVLENLIGNAVKFTHSGRIVVRVAAAGDETGTIRFDISDTGIGFSDDAITALFGSFDAIKMSAARGSVGLGLEISKHLVRLMNGELTVESQAGKGSVVSFTAEFGEVDNTALQAVPGDLRNKRIFLATSRASTRYQIGTYLSVSGAQYESSATPTDVIKGLRLGIASRRPFDAVILDLGEANADLAQSIEAHAAFSSMRIIALAPPQGGLELAGCKSLKKPVLPYQLSDAIIGP